MKTTIVCLGNRFIPKDAAGPAVFDRLQSLSVPHGVDVVEGGLAGLNLLPLLERGGRVIFVDTVSGFVEDFVGRGTIVVLDRMDIIHGLSSVHYGHESGLPYLLSVLPNVCEGLMPQEILLIGMEGDFYDDRFPGLFIDPGTNPIRTDPLIDRAAELALSIATNGLGERL